jgi:putative transposase
MYYRRANMAGGMYFFTVNLLNRRLDLLVMHVAALRAAVRVVKVAHPFEIVAMVVLPEHIHTVWHLPPGDADFPLRWALIKANFSRALSKNEQINASREKKRERGIWQRRYWEHLIRDEHDLARHIDYVHFNPVKHGWAKRAADWPYSSLHQYIARGELSENWAIALEDEGNYGEGS